MKALVLELLAAVCLVRGGHEIILAAFDNFKEVRGEWEPQVWAGMGEMGIGGDQGETGTASNGGNGDIRIRLGLGSRTQGTEEGRTPGPDWDRVTGGTRIRLGLGSRTPAMEELGTPGPIWETPREGWGEGTRVPRTRLGLGVWSAGDGGMREDEEWGVWEHQDQTGIREVESRRWGGSVAGEATPG